MLNQLKRKCNCLFHQARVCKYIIPLTKTPIAFSHLGYFNQSGQIKSVYCKTYNISTLIVLQEQGIHITFNFLNREYFRSSEMIEIEVMRVFNLLP